MNFSRVLGTIFCAVSIFTGAAAAGTYGPQHEQVKALFKSNAEPTAKDAVWTASDMFKVGVINDGTPRDAYANYVCSVLYDYGFSGKRIRVQIIDIARLTRSGEWKTLGEARCK